MKYYKVKFGFSKDDFYSIPETDLARALRAQITGTIFVCEDGTIAGNNIISISPDYNKLMGFRRDHVLDGEDYDQIGAKAVKEHRNFLNTTKREALNSGAEPKLIGHGKD